MSSAGVGLISDLVAGKTLLKDIKSVEQSQNQAKINNSNKGGIDLDNLIKQGINASPEEYITGEHLQSEIKHNTGLVLPNMFKFNKLTGDESSPFSTMISLLQDIKGLLSLQIDQNRKNDLSKKREKEEKNLKKPNTSNDTGGFDISSLVGKGLVGGGIISSLAALIPEVLLALPNLIHSILDGIKYVWNDIIVKLMGDLKNSLMAIPGIKTLVEIVTNIWDALKKWFPFLDQGERKHTGKGYEGLPEGGKIPMEELPTKQSESKSTPQQSLTTGNSIPIEGRALLESISKGESNSYGDIYGHKQKITDYSDHPYNVDKSLKRVDNSSASGKYQITQTTWNELVRHHPDLNDFSPKNQDKAAWYLAEETYHQKTKRDLETDLKELDKTQDLTILTRISNALKGRWTSLPGGSQENSITKATSFAQKYQDAKLAMAAKNVDNAQSSIPFVFAPVNNGSTQTQQAQNGSKLDSLSVFPSPTADRAALDYGIHFGTDIL